MVFLLENFPCFFAARVFSIELVQPSCDFAICRLHQICFIPKSQNHHLPGSGLLFREQFLNHLGRQPHERFLPVGFRQGYECIEADFQML